MRNNYTNTPEVYTPRVSSSFIPQGLSREEEIRQQVTEYHSKHPEVWRLFCRFTFQMFTKGYAHYSVNAIFERIRWEMDAGGDGIHTFKLNNNYRAFYARRFMRAYPQHDGFFRTREQLSKKQFATRLPEITPNQYEEEKIV
jgi:hypothetical protein